MPMIHYCLFKKTVSPSQMFTVDKNGCFVRLPRSRVEVDKKQTKFPGLVQSLHRLLVGFLAQNTMFLQTYLRCFSVLLSTLELDLES